MVVAKLRTDLLAVEGKTREVTPQGLFEAPLLTKRSGIYDEIYAAGRNPATQGVDEVPLTREFGDRRMARDDASDHARSRRQLRQSPSGNV